MNLNLRNPHSVLAVLKHRPQDVLEVTLGSDRPSPAWEKVAELARSAGARVTQGAVAAPPARGRHGKGATRPKQEREGGAGAVVRPKIAEEWKLMCPDYPDQGVWLALDCLQDPHNVGAIFRTAGFFGVRGLLLTRDRSAPLSGTVYDVAAGGVEAIPHCLPVNLAEAIRLAKDRGLSIAGTSEHAESRLTELKSDRPWLIVMGNEERGLRRLTLDLCDVVCGIPAQGAVGSLNVSVATGVILSHVCGVT